MYKVPKQLGWMGQYSEIYDPITYNLVGDYEVEWADNVDDFTHDQATCFCDVTSKEEKEVEKIMNDEEFEDYLNLKYPATTLEVRI